MPSKRPTNAHVYLICIYKEEEKKAAITMNIKKASSSLNAPYPGSLPPILRVPSHPFKVLNLIYMQSKKKLGRFFWGHLRY